MTDSLAEDWVALWQSEMAAMAADRELRESWTSLLALWASAAAAALRFIPRPGSDAGRGTADGTAGAAQPPGTAPAVAAFDLGGDEARRLYERIADLESRLAAFERRTGPARSGKPKNGV